jgi:hypothetical protein
MKIFLKFECAKKKSNITEESPFIVCLTDAIEKSLVSDFDDQDLILSLERSIRDCIEKDVNIIKKAMSVAYFRKFIKYYI